MNKEVNLKVKRLAIVSIISGIFVITLLFMYFCKTNVLNNLIGFALVVLFLGIAIISVNEIGTIISEERLKETYIVTLREVLSNEFKEVKINKTNAVLKNNDRPSPWKRLSLFAKNDSETAAYSTSTSTPPLFSFINPQETQPGEKLLFI